MWGLPLKRASFPAAPSLRSLAPPPLSLSPSLPLSTPLQGFSTLAMRKLESLSAAKVFTSVLIRLQAPDRTVLQGIFSPLVSAAASCAGCMLAEEGATSAHLPRAHPLLPLCDVLCSPRSLPLIPSPPSPSLQDTLADVYSWAAEQLLPPAERPSFYLFSTPPPSHVPSSEAQTLESAKLVPAALLHLAWGESPSARAEAPAAFLAQQAQELACREAPPVSAMAELLPSAQPLLAPASASSATAALLHGTEAQQEAALEAAAAALLSGGSGSRAGAGKGGAGAGAGAAGKPSWLKITK